MVKKWILGEFVKKNIVKYLIGIAALIATSLLQTSIPQLQGNIIDKLRERTADQKQITFLVLLMVGIALTVFLLKFTWRYFLMGRARDLECFLRAKLFAHFQSLDTKFYNNRKTGELMAYAINDLGAVRRAFAFGLVFLIDGVVINLASLVVMVKIINPILTVIALCPVILSVFLLFKLRSKIRDKFTEVQEAFADISEKTQENISGIRVVKAYVQEKYEIEKLQKASDRRTKVQLDYVKLSGLLGPSVQICFGVSFTLVLIIGSNFVSKGVITLGNFVSFNMYLAMLTRPITHIGKIVEVWQNALASIKRLDDIFEKKSEITDEDSKVQNIKFKGNIEIRNLSFKYPGSKKYALKNIDIKLESGKTLALIGRTGSGKTTLVNLLLKLYKTERNKIFIDGIDINDIDTATLRENIGCVPQDNFLFSTTIKQNVAFFNKEFNDDQVINATKMSGVYDDIAEFPDGFNTVIGERGITLSGGQKQRVSIARAFIKDPSILILDDCLSAVDTRTEEKILNNIKNILKDRTGIIIAHRISTIKHADEIIVLDDGEIIERGTHEELLKHRGSYYKLYNAQLAESSLQQEEEDAAV